jgi:hypothetical protein
MCIAKERKDTKITVFGDSMMVIRTINKRSQSENNALNGIISRILSLRESFVEFKIYHIKRDLNPIADHWEKFGTRLKSGIINLNVVRGNLHIS